MSRLQRIARTILAALPEMAIKKLALRYHVHPDWIQTLENEVHDVPNADTVVEWMLLLESKAHVRLPEDIERIRHAATFFFTHRNTQRFRDTVINMHFTQNPKNLFEFELYDIEDIEARYQEPQTKAEIERMNRLQELPPGAELVYNKNGVQVAKVTDSKAACALGKGTKWCTSNEETAAEYLNDGPLYIFYEKGKKVAQMHLGAEDNPDFQLMDLRDRAIDPDSAIRAALKEMGLWYTVLDSFLSSTLLVSTPTLENRRRLFESLYNDEWKKDEGKSFKAHIATSPVLSFKFAELRHRRFPEGEPAIATDGNASLSYAVRVLHGRFPAGEPAIAQSHYCAYQYALNAIKGPFPLGEPVIATNGEYSAMYAQNVLHDRFPAGEEAILDVSSYKNSVYFQFFVSQLYSYIELVTEKGKLKEFFADHQDNKWVQMLEKKDPAFMAFWDNVPSIRKRFDIFK